MTIMARDADTGMAKWFYQMTPHDEWDYDGINEMILTNQKIDGKERKLLTHFDRNGLGYTLDREMANCWWPEVRSGGELDHRRRHGPGNRKPMAVPPWCPIFDPTERRGHELDRHLPGGAGVLGPAAGGLLAQDRAVLCAHEPRLHGL